MSAGPALPQLSLRAVTAGNIDAVRALAPKAAQQDFIASNAESLALAAAHPHMHARAIYVGDVLAGFALYAEPGPAGRQDTHVLYRLMLAAGWQERGLGRHALELLLDEMRARGAARVALYYAPANLVARQLYASAGFVETGIDAEGEMLAVRTPA
ncbi:GNAT family N-acetyltransferase [Janthinobacterium rivuli]|uniref:GNAT family N-acetyltransferase n=1 Tax=Janthinobacterium sp. FT68W TaxID=2654255 RepID=UPI0012644DE7|nr:GNAT family N-acetyltransferase [Janthinobacterium sp. FT68W]KAB8047829.1 GNAT family N-acetyltransferase [Janthinobacterium sp. FT68W]